MTMLDVTPEVARRLYEGTTDRQHKALILWALHHGYWIGSDGSDVLTLMEPHSRLTRIANWLRFKGIIPWKQVSKERT